MSNKMDFIKKVLENIPEEKKKDADFVFKVNEKNPEAFDMLIESSELKDDKDFAIKAMHAGTEIASRVYDHMNENLKMDEDVIFAALESTKADEKAPMFFDEEKKDEVVFPTLSNEKEEVKEDLPGMVEEVHDEPVIEHNDSVIPSFNDVMDPKPVEREFPFKDDLNYYPPVEEKTPNEEVMSQMPPVNNTMMGMEPNSNLNEFYNMNQKMDDENKNVILK